MHFKRIARVFEVRLYEVHMYSECITHSRWQSVSSTYGEADGTQDELYIHPNKTDVSLNVHYIKNMFTALICYQTAFSVRKLKFYCLLIQSLWRTSVHGQKQQFYLTAHRSCWSPAALISKFNCVIL